MTDATSLWLCNVVNWPTALTFLYKKQYKHVLDPPSPKSEEKMIINFDKKKGEEKMIIIFKKEKVN